MARFDIIIVTFNAKSKLRRCLTSVLQHTTSSVFTLTVVDNHSTDGTAKLLESFGDRIRVLRTSSNRGFSYAANLGIKSTQQAFIALLDDDIEVTASWLDGLYTYMRPPQVGIVGAKIVYPNGRIFSADFSVRRLHKRGAGEMDRGQRDYVKPCDALTGPCWLIRRTAYESVGDFDERFFPCQAEDIDYCLRMRMAGYKIIYAGNIRIIHHSLYRTSGFEKKNVLRFLRKWKKALNNVPFKDSHPSEKALEKGLDLWDQQQYAPALTYLRRVEGQVKGLVDPYYLAVACFKTGNKRMASRLFERGLKLYVS